MIQHRCQGLSRRTPRVSVSANPGGVTVVILRDKLVVQNAPQIYITLALANARDSYHIEINDQRSDASL